MPFNLAFGVCEGHRPRSRRQKQILQNILFYRQSLPPTLPILLSDDVLSFKIVLGGACERLCSVEHSESTL